MTSPHRWLTWAQKIQAIAQIGLTYAENDYDRQRYAELHALAEEIFGAHTGAAPAQVAAWFAAQPGYATPKVDVRTACFRQGQVLLVREKSDGRWCLPGGWADVGDAPALSAAREVQEEAGYTARITKVIGVFDANRSGQPLSAYHAFKIIFWGELDTAPPVDPDHEINEIGFFAPDDLPPLSENRTGRHHLAECFAHLADPHRLTAFD